MHNTRLPSLAITLGDPSGVGPETVVGAWRQVIAAGDCSPLVVGHPVVLRRALDLLGLRMRVQEIVAPEQAAPAADCIPCLAAGDDSAAAAPPAVADARGGQAAYDALTTAGRMALDRRIDGIVTAPLHKGALWKAGHRYPGHTELLAEMCGVRDFAMMLYLAADDTIRAPAGLGVVHVTLHMALRRAVQELSTEAILAKIRLCRNVMQSMRGAPPRIGVCALNPHAGEEGLFGDEETRLIAPAVMRAVQEGIDAVGPLAADTLFVKARDGAFDGIVAMYHDQGHIPLKLLGMHRAVNITLGLPIIRTSVAHGTAFDLAWTGRAETSSMVEAVRVAARLASPPGDARSVAGP